MKKSIRIYIVPCGNYSLANEAISEILELAGGIQRFALPGEAILIKPNLLLPCPPERAVTTHPSLVRALAEKALEAGASVTVGDSPGAGFRYSEATLNRLYRTCGLTQALRGLEVSLNKDTGFTTVSNLQGGLVKRFEMLAPAARADGILSVSKLKTHMFMHMTGAVKNSFGLIPGLRKAGYHAALRDTRRFAGMLLDLDALAAPRLHIMDAVLALEGDGPGTSGTPRHVGLVLASTSSLAVDLAASALIGLPEESNPVIMEARSRGMTPNTLEQVDIVGPDIRSLVIRDFKRHPDIDTGGTGMNMIPSLVRPRIERFVRNTTSLKPVISRDRCVACGVCEITCPVKAITLEKGALARIDEARCIRCYCCHEMCDSNAVLLEKSSLYRLLTRFL